MEYKRDEWTPGRSIAATVTQAITQAMIGMARDHTCDNLRTKKPASRGLFISVMMMRSGERERIIQIGNQIRHVFNADGEAHHFRSRARLFALLIGQLTMCC